MPMECRNTAILLMLLFPIVFGCQKETKPSPWAAVNTGPIVANDELSKRMEYDPYDALIGTPMERPKSIDTSDIVAFSLTINGQDAIDGTPEVPAGEELRIEASVCVKESLAHPFELPLAVGALKTPYVTVFSSLATRAKGDDDWRSFRINNTDTMLSLRTDLNSPLKAAGQQSTSLKLDAGEYNTRFYISFYQSPSVSIPRWVAQGQLKVVDKELNLQTEPEALSESQASP